MISDPSMRKACPIYERAIAQAVDHGVPIEDAALAMVVFSMGSLIGAIGPERASHRLGEISAALLVAAAVAKSNSGED